MEHRMQDIIIPDFDLTGKVAVITGGTKGLGYGMALTLAHYGADVVVASRTEADCQRVAKEIKSLGRRSAGIMADVTNVASCDAMIEKAVAAMGKIDIMICNAGVGSTAVATDMTEEQWDYVNDVDIKGVFFSARAAARQMIAQGTGGKIICISSAAAMGGSKGIAHYCAAKAAVVNLVKALAIEWARYGITVNAVCPGYVPTSINEKTLSNEKVKERIEKHALVRRLGRIEEISAPVLLLASNFSGYITGTSILADGGGRA
ncbi:2-dehydro-3-deoxy-D-gluconate 5-dehydrogenase [bioreactor metagenome]|uniref:2-dehydro-3-deoxy-D-gluconate 5-dehydrogenase n=1 Tax=bioreactor metagenome TaxID=1076179 RepID=A0A644W4Q3_9ZZZZ